MWQSSAQFYKQLKAPTIPRIWRHGNFLELRTTPKFRNCAIFIFFSPRVINIVPKMSSNTILGVRKLMLEAASGGSMQSAVAGQFHVNQSTFLFASWQSLNWAWISLNSPWPAWLRKTTDRLDCIIWRKSTAAARKTAVGIVQKN